MSGASLLPSLILGIWTLQGAPPPEPVAPDGPPPEVGIAPAEVESTPAVQRPNSAPDEMATGQDAPEPAAASEPAPETAVAPAEPAPEPGVATSQQIPEYGGGSSAPPPASGPVYVPTDPKPGEDSGRGGRKNKDAKAKKGGSLYNPLWLSVGLGVGFMGQGRGALNVGADATYFFIPWVGAGADIGNTFFFGVDEDQVSNIFTFTPTLTILMAPRARLSPYVRGGVGPIVYNRGGGTLGRWIAGGGVVSRFNRAFINVGVDVSAQFPDEKYGDLVGAPDGCLISTDPCSLNIIPRIGIGFALGSRR